MFTLGFGLILSTISVFLRDMFYIYGIVVTLWTYLTPIMYDISIISEKLQIIFKLNPLYYYITFIREIILYHRMPSELSFIICGISSLLFLAIGLIVFKKNQDKFIYYV